MTIRAVTLRLALASTLLAGAAWSGVGLTAALAQDAAPKASPLKGLFKKKSAAPAPAAQAAAAPGHAAPLDLYVLPPVPHDYQPKRTAWGDPDLRGVWPIDSLGGLPMQRTPAQGNRVFMTDEEYAASEARMERSRNAAAAEDKANKLGMGNWVEMTGAGRRTSLVVDPPNGRLPELTPEGKRLQAAGRSSWVRNQTFDWVDDFDAWDRCVSRGFPASMLPFRYNNGIQIFQSPGYVVIKLEMLGTRVIPLDGRPLPPKTMTTWLGESRGHWEGATLVIETDRIRPGDSATHDVFKRNASPLNMATIGVPPNNTIPTSDQAHVVERLTPTGPDSIVYEFTYSDPVYWTAPFTVRLDWTRNDKYGMFEYACHEGDVQIRNYIQASRAQRAADKLAADEKAAAQAAAEKAAADQKAAEQAAQDRKAPAKKASAKKGA